LSQAVRELQDRLGGLVAAPIEAERPCLIEPDSASLSYPRVAERALALAGRLMGERKPLVVLLTETSASAVIGLLGALAAGAAVALVDRATAPDALARLWQKYGPDFLVSPASAPSFEGYDPVGADADGIAVLKRTVPMAGEIHPDLFVLLTTSGTTGSSKFVRLSRRAVVANASAVAEVLDIGPQDVAVGHLPLHYSYGMSVLTSHLSRGGGFLLMQRGLTDAAFWQDVAAGGGTHFPGVPFHYQLLLRSDIERGVPACVRTFTQAGGRLDPKARIRVRAAVSSRGGRFYVMYGQTEASPRMTTLPWDRFAAAPASVGWPLRDGRIAIVDEDGQLLPAGVEGEVVFHGPNVMMGYAEGRGDLSLGDVQGGRLATGDRGTLNEAGCLTITGRQQHYAKVGGLRLSLDEIEAQLKPPFDVVLLPGQDQIVVFHTASSSAVELRARCSELARDQGIPPVSYRLRELEALPVLSSGKIDFAHLRGLL
jgi:acyl-CoA synthetase (AMP-forming)/AMP-acid ligase II